MALQAMTSNLFSLKQEDVYTIFGSEIRSILLKVANWFKKRDCFEISFEK